MRARANRHILNDESYNVERRACLDGIGDNALNRSGAVWIRSVNRYVQLCIVHIIVSGHFCMSKLYKVAGCIRKRYNIGCSNRIGHCIAITDTWRYLRAWSDATKSAWSSQCIMFRQLSNTPHKWLKYRWWVLTLFRCLDTRLNRVSGWMTSAIEWILTIGNDKIMYLSN